MKIAPMFLSLLLAATIATVVNAAPASVEENDVGWWWGEGPVGLAKIVRNKNGISGNWFSSLSNGEGSAEGLAVTLWIIIFNYPEECATPYECTEGDLFNPDVEPDALYGAGNIVDSSEEASFGFHRKRGDNSGSIANLFGMPTDGGEPYGLRNPRGAEVHYVLRLHGPMNPEEMPAQIHTYPGGCITDAPYGYLPPAEEGDLVFGEGDCQDVQAAINQAE